MLISGQLGLVCATLAPAVCAAAGEPPRVALLYSDYGDSRHRDDYDARLEGMGWPVTKFENTEFDELVAQLDAVDIVLGSALFNYSNVQDLSVQREALVRFMQQGGAILLTDCNYPAHLNWLAGMGEGWAVTCRNTDENPTPMGWMDVRHPILTTPNRLDSVGGSWAHMDVGDAWTPLARSQAGGVTVAIRDQGRGYILLTSRWPYQQPMLENLWTYLQFRRAGIVATLPDLASAELGENRLRARMTNLADTPKEATLEIRDDVAGRAPATVRVAVGVPPKGTAEAELVLNLTERGEHTLTAAVAADGVPVVGCPPVRVDIPPLLAVDVLRPRYRGSVYASRPPTEITLGLQVVPDPGAPLPGLDVHVEPSLPDTDELAPIAVAEMGGQGARLSFPLRQVPDDGIRVGVELRRGAAVIAAEEITIPVVATGPHQVYLDDDGAAMLDGQPFFPAGIYHVRLEDFGRLPGMGFNTVVAWGSTLDGARKALDAADKAGLKAVLEMSRFLRGEMDLEGLGEVVRGVREHPALLAWYSVDEPSGKQREWCRAAYEMLVDTEPDHPVYLVMCSPPAFAEFAPTTDILAVDPYPVPSTPIEMVTNWVKTAQRAVRPGQPVWVIPQCHSPAAYRDPNAGRGPTPDEERCMVYQGIISGAKGVIYYPWDDGPTGLVHDSELMAAVAQINAELQEIGPELLASEWHTIADDDPPGLRAASFIGKARSYVIATNTGEDPIEARLPLPGFLDAEVDVLFEGRSVLVEAGVIRDTLEPLAVHVYRIVQP